MPLESIPPNQQEQWDTAPDGVRLYCRRWPAAGPARAAAISLHGLGDHSGLYPMLGRHLRPLGVTVYAPDLRGNGKSGGPRGHIESWSELRGDLHRLVVRVRSAEPGVPLFLIGTSLGGLVVLDYTLLHAEGISGVIALSPPLGALGVPPPLLALGRLFSRLWPRFSLETGMDLSGLTRDPAVLAQVRADPLFHRRGTARLSTEVTDAIARVQAAAARFPRPALLLHGAADRMVPADGSRQFAARAAAAGVRLIEYPEAYHALLGDLDAERVLANLSEWMLERL